MAYVKVFFFFLNGAVMPTHNRRKVQSNAADNKAYRSMQSIYANCMVNSKAAESGCLHVNVEEK